MALGHVIREKRQLRGMSQKELAQAADVNYQTIGAIENSRNNSSYVIGRIAKALGTDPAELMRLAHERADAIVPDIGELVKHLMAREGMTRRELADAMGATLDDVDDLCDGDASHILWGAAAVALHVPLHTFERVAVNGFDPVTDSDIVPVLRDETLD